MIVTAKYGKVVLRIGKCQCTLPPERAVKLALRLHDAAAKAAKKAKQFQEA